MEEQVYHTVKGLLEDLDEDEPDVFHLAEKKGIHTEIDADDSSASASVIKSRNTFYWNVKKIEAA